MALDRFDPQSFDFELYIDGVKTPFHAELVDTPDPKHPVAKYLFYPKEDPPTEDTDPPNWVDVPFPYPPTLADLMEPEHPGDNNRLEIHNLAVKLHTVDKFSYKQISDMLTKQGYTEVTARTVAKHVRGECACLGVERPGP